MLDTVSRGFKAARNRLAGKTEITEENIAEAVRDIRVALLEADVDFKVAKAFVNRVKEKAIGEVVQLRTKKKKDLRVSPSDHFIKICHDELEELMGPVEAGLTFARGKEPTKIMMVGLQGSGKTTTTAKLARRLQKEGKKPLLVAADVYRPAAVEQLQTLGRRLEVPVFHEPEVPPPQLCRDAVAEAKKSGRDVVIFDTAGRLAIDEEMMQELEQVKAGTSPENILLVVDAMIGQDAVRTAAEFDRRLDLTGFVMTKLDGDARGGAALSIKEVTGKPIKFLGIGEDLDKLEEFRPEGLASRILGFGDIVGLMQDFEEVVDEETAEKDAEKILSGNFDLDDFVRQIETIQKMGSLTDLLEKFPIFGELPEGFHIDDRELVRVRAMVSSMTRAERANPEILDRSRIERVARGSGTKVEDVSGLIARFRGMRDLFAKLGPQGGMGLLSRLPGMRNLAMLKNLKGQGAELAELFGGLGGSGPGVPGAPAAALAGGGSAGVTPPMMTQAQLDRARLFGYQQQNAPRELSAEERRRRKNKRKQERKARQKARRRNKRKK
ncbi:MAG: signal recognition particle protein [Deltaproteobacteria bacterium]|nr:MAG: signal recognition particle protein [Deltaproteobacteria bacterium]